MIPLAQPMEFYRTFIEWYCSQVKVGRYLEIGCADGGLVQRVAPLVTWATGVDPRMFSWPAVRNVQWWNQTSDDFFENCDAQFDLVLIDGDHAAYQVFKDADNALRCLAPSGLILLHDTYPPDKDHTRPDACGDAWKAAVALEEASVVDEIEVFTFPVTYGLTLLRKKEAKPWL